VQLNSDGGVLTVPVEISGAITLDFVIDSGASDVNIPADVVSTLIRTRTIRPSDFIGQQTYVLADGTEAPSAIFIIRSLKIGGRVVENVRGSIGSSKGSLLLGQSFLRNFRSWSIDNGKHALVLE
jgi:predicted aspartyl protease